MIKIFKDRYQPSKGAVFAILFALGLISKLLYKFPSVNEFDVVVFAKHFVDRSWIAGDWYLSQEIGYRTLFNLIVGGAAKIIPLPALILLGRSIIIALFAFAVSKIAAELKIKLVALVPIYVYFLSNQSMFAGEWMIGGLETKPFAYCSILFALYFAMRKRPKVAAALLGLAFSFHMLVGFYGGFCIAAASAIVYRKSIIGNGFKRFIEPISAYIIAGAFGIYSIVQYISASSGADQSTAGEIYVLYRVAHHVLPSAWANELWLPLSIMCAIILVAGAIFIREKPLKLLLIAASMGFVFFGIGAILFLTNNIPLLRFYWFRFPDVFTTFAIGLAISTGISRIVEKTKFTRRRNILILTCIALSIMATAISIVKFADQIKSTARSKPYRYARVDEDLGDMLLWISWNTPKDAVFLVSPAIEEFYYLAERTMFISLKHSPQTANNIIEWFDRLKLCSGGESLPAGVGIFGFHEILESRFYNLSKDDLHNISELYRIDYYLDCGEGRLDMPIMHENADFRLYAIERLPIPH